MNQAANASALRGGRHPRRILASIRPTVGIAAFLLLLLAVAPGGAWAEQAASHTRALLSGRIDGGISHTCAITADGALRCWGSGASGRLGYGNTTTIGDNEAPGSVGPVDLGSGRTATAVAAGNNHTCAIANDGTVHCWGVGTSGQLGYGNTETIGDNETPAAVGSVDLGGRSAVGITAGSNFSCALLDNGTVRCWGTNASGQLGYGNTTAIGDNETPATVSPVELGVGRTAVAISSGTSHTCAILDNGTVRCWGSNSNGELGYGNTTVIGDTETPGSVGPVDLGAGRTATAIAAGNGFTCALLDNGTVRCWGAAGSGQLGYGNTTAIGDNETPGTVGPVDLGAGRSAVAIAAGSSHACAVLDDGTMRCWGFNLSGQLGYGNTTTIGDNETPGSVAPIDLGTGLTAVAVSAGESHTCAWLDNGTVRCWGLGTSGRLGYGNTTTIGDNEAPGSAGPVEQGSVRGVLQVVTGGFNSCALMENGTVRCWGSGSGGRLGLGPEYPLTLGDNENPGSVPPIDLGAGRRAIQITSGESHACALLDNGTVRCWGNGASGRLGYANIATVGDDETPGSVGPVNLGRSAVAIAAGGSHTCAVLDNGTVRCWGAGESGRLGYGNTTTIGDDETPNTVGPVTLGGSAIGIATGGFHTCATLSDHTLRCWGSGSVGALGYGNSTTIGDNETPSSAGAVAIGRSALSVAAGNGHTCAPLDNGTARCWGANNVGQLGYGNTTYIGDNELPTTVGTLDLGAGRNAVAISTGSEHSCAILDNGSVRCWGVGTSGQLGYGNTKNIGDDETPGGSGPVDLGAGRTAISVSASRDFSCAALDNGTVRCWGVDSLGQLGYGNTKQIGDDETPGSVAPVDLWDDAPVAVNDSDTFNEDPVSPRTIEVLANDTDVDGGQMIINSVTNGTHGTVAITNGGSRLTYSPEANYCGSDSFTYTLNGGSTATVSVTVNCVDDLPVAVNDSATLNEDAGATAIEVLANDTDVDGGPKSVVSKANGGHGTVSITGGGAGLTYQPDSNYCGPDTFTYILNGGSTATVSVTVNCVDDPPVAINDSASLNEDAGATSIDVLANDTDVDGGPKTVSSKTNAAHGTVAITGGGTGLTYQPEANFCGGDSFTYQLNGGSQATVSVAVNCVDDPPLAIDDSKTVAEDSSATPIDVLANDTDIDGGAKTITTKSNGSHGTVAITGGGSGLTYLPEANYCGPDSFTYTLNGGAMGTVLVTVSCVDDPPVAVNDLDSLPEDSSATAIGVLANDTDIDGGPKTIVAKTNGAHGTVTITGEGAGLTYLPDANYCGSDSFTYQLNGSSQATVSITVTCVDDPPSAVDDVATVAEDAVATAIDVRANDSDIDGGPKSVESKTDGSHGTVAITGGGSGLTYLPEANYCGPDSFTYTLNGGSTATVSVTVTCVDDPPTAVNDSAGLVEDEPATSIDVLANDTDIDGGPKTVIAKVNGGHGTVAIAGGGSEVTYLPEANYCGSDLFTYTLNGGSTANVSVTISCVDDPPNAVNDLATVGEDSSATAIDVLANDTDVDGGTKTVVSKTSGTHGAVAITGGGTGLTYQPDTDYCGSDSFTYQLNGGSSATVSVTVSCVDDPPVAVDDSATVSEGSSATSIEVLGNDTDIDGGPKTISSKSNGAHGTVAIIGGGTGLTYQPNVAYCGPDSFTYKLNGGSQATVSITVTCVDDPPTAIDDSASMVEDASTQAIDVLANDTDTDGGPKNVASKTNGNHGTVSITGGGSGVSYTPDANYCGSDSFTYTLNGGSTATVLVGISCVDDVPTAVNDSATLAEDASPTAIEVLANDTDVDGGAKEVASKANGSHGTVAITGGGSGLTYVPAANYCGPDSFTYKLNGGSQATVSITVTCVDDLPIAVNDSDSLLEDAPATAIDVLANDTDVDGGPKLVTARTNGSDGTVAIIGGGAGLTYTPAPHFCGNDSFTYTLNGGSQATVSITVTCVDEPPPSDQGSGGQVVVPVPSGPGGSSAPIVNITPGIGVVSGRRHPRVAVKGSFAFFTLTCKHSDKDCAGTVTVTANIPSVALGPAEKVTLVKGKFRIAAGRSVLVRAKLTKIGLEVLRKRSLRGVGARMGIVDTGNGESGKIEVNLVRRPKASLLPSGDE